MLQGLYRDSLDVWALELPAVLVFLPSVATRSQRRGRVGAVGRGADLLENLM